MIYDQLDYCDTFAIRESMGAGHVWPLKYDYIIQFGKFWAIDYLLQHVGHLPKLCCIIRRAKRWGMMIEYRRHRDPCAQCTDAMHRVYDSPEEKFIKSLNL